MNGVWYNTHIDAYAGGENLFFVAREKGKAYEFSCHTSEEEFFTSSISKAKNPSFHELVPEWRPRKLHFDFDCPFVPADKAEYIDDLIQASELELGKLGIALKIEEIIVLDASNTTKTSVHVILPVAVTSASACKKLCEDIICCLRQKFNSTRYDYAAFFDMGVYARNRCFRMAFCSKRAQKRPLLPIPFSYKGREYKHGVELPKLDVYKKATLSVLSEDIVIYSHPDEVVEDKYSHSRVLQGSEQSKVVELVKSRFTDSEWRFAIGKSKPGYIELKRTGSGPCRICCRIHGEDSTGDNAAIRISNEGRISFVCWRNTSRPLYITTMDDKSGHQFAQSELSSAYLAMPDHHSSSRTSEDYIACLIEKYGFIE